METARVLHVEAQLPKATQLTNQFQHDHLFELVEPMAARGAVICITHMAYKSGTDVTTESAGDRLLYKLHLKQARVTDNPRIADVVVITLPEMPADWTPRPGQTVIDCWRIMKDIPPGVTYIAIGRGEAERQYA
jgi:hypothetical protein